jgi:hypothetical protein
VSARYRVVELSRLDPIERPESPWRAALTIAAVVAYAVLLGGCGASTLDRATTAYGVAHALQSGAVATVRREVRDDLREACAGETSPAAIDACITERAERWRAAEAGLDVSAAALDVAGAELLAWAEDGDPDAAPRTACERLSSAVEAVAHVVRLLDALGVRLPDGLPSWTCGGER